MTVTTEDARIIDLVRQVPIPHPFDRNVLIENLARQRGKPIELMPMDASALVDSPCGMWVEMEDSDRICYEASTTEYHIDQIVCHEIGHMMLGHRNLTQSDADNARKMEWCRQAMPGVDPALILAMFGRTNRSTGDERDAEMFAHLLMVAATETRAPQSMMSSVFLRR